MVQWLTFPPRANAVLASTVFYVIVIPRVALEDLGENGEVPGAYAIEGDRDVGIADSLCVTDVLDAFHEGVCITELDQFDIRVISATGEVLSEPETITSGVLLPRWGKLSPEFLAPDGVAWLAKFLTHPKAASEH